MSKSKYTSEQIGEILADFRLANESREASLLGRKEVLTGKAKFGIFGDGKEIPQIAMAKVFDNGDFRSGYYRDQTFAMATGTLTIKGFFAQLYADPDVYREPASGGRMMNCHFSTRSLDENGNWLDLTKQKNLSADISPTAGQMQRLLGLAYASKYYRLNQKLHNDGNKFSVNGNEIAFGTIGNASCAEGIFWETINAGGVLMVPMLISIWDDGYGISVPNEYQVAKSNISELLKGFEYDKKTGQGYNIFSVKAWDYESLIDVYKHAATSVRTDHIPSIIHVTEVTQPQGHSTSGSHERYKSKERLDWEKEYCCINQMKLWIVNEEIASKEEVETIEKEAKEKVHSDQKEAWDEFLSPILKDRSELESIIESIAQGSENRDALRKVKDEMLKDLDINRKVIAQSVLKSFIILKDDKKEYRDRLTGWYSNFKTENEDRYSSTLMMEGAGSALNVKEVKPVYSDNSPSINGSEILKTFFDKTFESDERVFAIGEDVGKIGDVNQGMAGLQEKYGELRVTDTGIRESTIIGQGIGAAMRGLKPIVEIQYLDYLLFGLQPMSDDIATLLYRTKAGQKCPVIVRTRGHRLEGIWHTGSPMGMIINSLRGMHVCVPRNMTQAAGMYKTILQSDDPALIVERLNAYRLKEKLADNIGEYNVPLGVPEIITEGEDITIVTYGACVDIAKDAIRKLSDVGVSCELIDVQTLLPFDVNRIILESLKKTNRILFLDEDVPGGASAYMLHNVLDVQGGYQYLDSKPVCLAAKEHRSAYGTDGDYFSKPNAEDVFRTVYNIMHETNPELFSLFF
ncbi:MAG: thiamine pyrophosphate-dependent enzyme [Ignavibacteriaceae bacterium]|jgi:pyruvate/2-oxoglutarate/acetoin dehydrogenase E1 component/TPP-dependent pyruvate/acetoin dehydrogenase alpha subunit|nr:MAG: transketolase [Chlorobiota bacterium]KXK04565.1 MAG: 2-oxoisovalerate dehydrogenase E1 component [Chlorobi bacterium OLB4]MBV6399387.1 1-deoxy-D-xylulose-5-phosphate synthase [Ignavibacteria bacterium]MCC6886860.1 hypothetical protein [Ignavibacteriales bacterium]MCE7953915.1 transketolase [Chlorobi bacterium CHB7]MDL1887848.1 transketolase [Ignavibacteria bacterium CHB1]MEB2330521.1 thiamine pyrophosphate-dependent enzyme [Ignavibacteriaceae bacterium]OQY76475.1 MAG: transketolase [